MIRRLIAVRVNFEHLDDNDDALRRTLRSYDVTTNVTMLGQATHIVNWNHPCTTVAAVSVDRGVTRGRDRRAITRWRRFLLLNRVTGLRVLQNLSAHTRAWQVWHDGGRQAHPVGVGAR